MGFHGIRRAPLQMTQVFRGIPWNIPWNSMNSGAAKWHITLFHGIPWHIPRNSMELWCRQMTYHLVPWNIPWNSMELWCRQMTYYLVPWNSMKYSMEFHGTLVPTNEVSLTSMELWDRHFMAFYPSWNSKGYSMEFHGTLESPNKKSPSSMGFQGIRKAPLQMTQVSHGIPWNIHRNVSFNPNLTRLPTPSWSVTNTIGPLL